MITMIADVVLVASMILTGDAGIYVVLTVAFAFVVARRGMTTHGR